MGTTRTPSRNGSEKPKAPPEGEKGTSFAWGFEGISPQDILGKRLKPSPTDLDEMISVDGWALAMYAALTWPIRGPKWTVVDADGDSGEGELCRQMLDPLLRRIVAGMCQAVGHGVAYAEPVWDITDDGTILLEDVVFRPISTCRPVRDRNGRVVGFRQVAYGSNGMVNEEFLVENRKAFIYAHDSTTNPGVGKSAFETAYQYFKDKRKVLFYRFKNLEKFGGPTTVGRTAASGEKRRAFETAVKDARNGGAIIIDQREKAPDEVSYLQTPNAGLAFRQAITDLNFEMAVSAQVQYLAYAQEGNSGSYNASDVQQRLLRKITEGRIDEMEGEATKLCQDICEVNFGLDAAVPTIEAESIDEEMKQLVKEAAEMLFGKRPIPDWLAEEVTEEYAQQMGIEKPEDAEALGEPQETPDDAADDAGNANEGGPETP